jgi:hypothetical protein
MIDASQVHHRINEGALLRPSIHLIGIRDLNWPIIAMVIGDVLRAFCSLITVWRREGFRLHKKIQKREKIEVK